MSVTFSMKKKFLTDTSWISYESYQFTNICYIQVWLHRQKHRMSHSGYFKMNERHLQVLAHNECKKSGHLIITDGGGDKVATEKEKEKHKNTA